MNTFKKHYQNLKQFYEEQYFEDNTHQNRIHQTVVEGQQYFFTKCIFSIKKQFRSLRLECLLIAFQDPYQGRVVGYALKSDGFPKNRQKHPIFEDKSALSNFSNIESRPNSHGYLNFLVLQRNKGAPWFFEMFKKPDLIEKWEQKLTQIVLPPPQFGVKPLLFPPTEIKRPEPQNKIAEKQLNQQNKVIDNYQNQISNLSSLIENFQKQISQLQAENTNLRNKNDKLQENLRQMEKKFDQLSRVHAIGDNNIFSRIHENEPSYDEEFSMLKMMEKMEVKEEEPSNINQQLILLKEKEVNVETENVQSIEDKSQSYIDVPNRNPEESISMSDLQLTGEYDPTSKNEGKPEEKSDYSSWL